MTLRLRCLALLLLVLSFVATLAAQTNRIVGVIDETSRTQLKGNVHPLASARFDQGAAPGDMHLSRMLLVLSRSREQESSLRKFLDEQQTPGSPNFRHWIGPEEFGRRFGPVDSDVQTVASYLTGHGFHVERIAASRMVLEFSGTAANLRDTFGTQIHSYKIAGETHWANATEPSIPTALAPVVSGFASLNNFGRKHFSHAPTPYLRDSSGRVAPQLTVPTSGQTYYPLAPGDFSVIYNTSPLLTSGYDGSGQTIAIVGETQIDPQDATNFRSLFKLSTTPDNHIDIVVNGNDPGKGPDEVEADLDVQWSSAAAPGARIKLVISQSTETTSGVDLSALYIVDNNLADVVSESYGGCEFYMGTGGNTFYRNLWQQAAAQGITAVVSSGDSGSALCDNPNYEYQAQNGLAVNGIASTPYNVAVGGTDFDDATTHSTYWNSTNSSDWTSAKSYIPETTWNETCAAKATSGSLNVCPALSDPPPAGLELWSGSGGPSNCAVSSSTSCVSGTPKPSWQTGTGVPNDGVRDLPDVSLFASGGSTGSNSFFVVCNASVGGTCIYDGSGFTFLGVSGTSASAPSFAGVVALAAQKLGTRLGNINYLLYSAAAKSGARCTSSGSASASCVFYDTVKGNNSVPCKIGSPNCSSGTGSGVIVDGSNHPAFSTTTGYDLATGLGSINASNLVAALAGVSFTPSSLTFRVNGATSALTVQHGTPIDLSVGVTPSASQGTVAVAGTSNGITSAPLVGGTASWSSKMFPGGSYNVHAHYPGDGAHAASDSSAIALTLTPEPSKTLVSLVTFDSSGRLISFNATSATYGSGFALLRVDVGDAAASLSASSGVSSNCFLRISDCATGNIALANSGTGTVPATLPLNPLGFTEDQTIQAGTYSVTATYPGDAGYGASSGAATFSILKSPTTITPVASESTVQYGNLAQLSVEANSDSLGVAPTGTFSFYDNGALLDTKGIYASNSGTYKLGAWAEAIASEYFFSVGDHTLTASYSGDSNYKSVSGGNYTLTVQKAVTFFYSFGAGTTAVEWNTPLTFYAALHGSDRGDAPTGTIAFYDGTTPLTGTVTYTPSGGNLQANMPYTFTAPGDHFLRVQYSGDANHTSADGNYSVKITVGGPFSISSASNLVVSAPGNTGSETLTIAPLSNFTGTVTLSCTPDGTAHESTCGFVNNGTTTPTLDVTLNGANATATFSVATIAPHPLSSALTPPRWGQDRTELVFGCIFFLGMICFRRKRYLSLPSLLLAITFLFASCGGSSGGGTSGPKMDPGTPAGTYAFVVTGTTGTGSSAIVVNQQVTVVVK